MNALEQAVKKQKVKEVKITKALKDKKTTVAQLNDRYTRLFFTKNFPILMNGDATINTRLEDDALRFTYRKKEFEITAIGNPEVWVLRGLTGENGFRKFEFHITSKIPMEEQLLNMLKDNF